MAEVIHGQDSSSVERLEETILRILYNEDKINLLRFIQSEREADVAQALEDLPIEMVAQVFRTLLLGDVGVASSVLIELEYGTISQLYEHLNDQEWAWIFSELADDDVVAILDVFPSEAASKFLARMPQQDKLDVLDLMTWPEESAGRIMTNEFLAMDVSATVDAAVEKIRKSRDLDPTNLFYLYVTENDRLVGMVSLRQLLLSKRSETLQTLMKKDVTAIMPSVDQEEVAELFRKHDEVTVPVLDDESRILGIITVDDVIDVIDEESEEDLYAMIGSSDEELLVGDQVGKIVWLRLPWIFASFCGSLLVAWLMSMAEEDLFKDAAKVFVFVPLVCAMGGNVGVQSATIMARFLSTNQPDWREARQSTFKEAQVGMALGVLCGIGVGIFAWLWEGVAMMFTVMIAMISAMTTAATTGTIIPILMKRLGFDPALATGPFVTSFNDVLATIVYFSIAVALLPA